MDAMHGHSPRDWNIFFTSVFFVLGFSLVFSVVGILLQTALPSVSGAAQVWLGRIGGLVIILFGLFLLNLWTPNFLKRTHTIAVRHTFASRHLTSFVFGAAFAVGWTPCVTAALGAVLALAATHATGAFILLLSYTLGIGVPFLLVGLFVNQAQALIARAGVWIRYIQYFFGIILIGIGILIFVGELSKIANFEFLTTFLIYLNAGTSVGASIASANAANIALAFVAGFVSFLSPCILPLIPGFLSYLAGTAVIPKTHD